MKQKKSVYKNLLILDLNSTYFGVSCAHAYTNSQKNVNYISKSIQTHTLSLVRSRTVHTFFFLLLYYFSFFHLLNAKLPPVKLLLCLVCITMALIYLFVSDGRDTENWYPTNKKKNNRYSMTGSWWKCVYFFSVFIIIAYDSYLCVYVYVKVYGRKNDFDDVMW